MSTLFLVFGLIFPRLTLLITWMTGDMPNNDVPFALDVLAAFLAPRLLIAYYTWFNNEHVVWTALYVAAFFAMVVGQRSATRKR